MEEVGVSALLYFMAWMGVVMSWRLVVNVGGDWWLSRRRF